MGSDELLALLAFIKLILSFWKSIFIISINNPRSDKPLTCTRANLVLTLRYRFEPRVESRNFRGYISKIYQYYSRRAVSTDLVSAEKKLTNSGTANFHCQCG